jgi:hypothetical protein
MVTRFSNLAGVSCVLTGGCCVNAKRGISRGRDYVDPVLLEDWFKDRSCLFAQTVSE